MKITAALVIIAQALLAGCAAPAAVPTATPTQRTVAPMPTHAPSATAPPAAPTNTPTSMPKATATTEPTNTSTPVPAYTLSGTVFFDYNGNGLRDDGEPPIQGVPIRVAGLTTSSGPDGTYSIAGVPDGSQQLYVQSPTQEPATAFRYINRFLGWVDLPAYEMNGVSVPAQHLANTKVQTIDQPSVVALDGDQRLDIALMLGFLTLPFRAEDCDGYILWNYFDLQPGEGVRNYAGDTTRFVAERVVGTENSHKGLDYKAEVGSVVLAAAPGVVILTAAEGDNPYNPGDRFLELSHGDAGKTTYHHLLPTYLVSLGEQVLRGQIIALSGDTGSSAYVWPHLHFDLYRTKQIDPYRDMLDDHSLSYWTVDNRPQFP